MKINPACISPCSLYCDVCAIRIANRDNNQKLKQKLVDLYKGGIPGKGVLPNCENLTVDDIHCKGCLSDDRFMHCHQCDIRDCVTEKRIEGCHKCDNFPCSHIDNFPMTVGKTVILRSVPLRKKEGLQQWIRKEEKRYYCPDFGNKVFRGVRQCNQCKVPLELD